MNDAACMNRRIAALERTIAYLEQTVKDLDRKMVDHLYTRDGEVSELVKRIFELEERTRPVSARLSAGIGESIPDPEFDWAMVNDLAQIGGELIRKKEQMLKDVAEYLVKEGVLPPPTQPVKVETVKSDDSDLAEILEEARQCYGRIKKEPMPGEVIHTSVDEYGNRSYVKVSPKPPDDDESAQSTVVEGPK